MQKNIFFFFYCPMISKHDEHKDLRDSNVTELITVLHEIKEGSSDNKQLCVFRISKATIESNKQIFQQELFPCLKPFRKDLQPSY